MKCGIVFGILGLSLLISFTVWAESPVVKEAGICFSNSDGALIVKQLEDYNNQVKLIQLLKEENAELEKKIVNLEKINKLQEDQLAVDDGTIKKLTELQETQKKEYEKQIKEAKPSFFEKLKMGFGGAMIGGLAVAILALI